VRDEIERYRRSKVQPFGVNPAGAEAHATYAAKLKLPFPLLSDPERHVSRLYQAVKPDGRGIIRTVYLIDQDGTVLFAATGAPGAEVILEGVQP
jgi:thioredoxin-dependent peroxiredoxin